jgi:hypothetical protein
MYGVWKFLIGVVGGALALVVALALFFVYLDHDNRLKAPSFANRLSFDEKMRQLRHRPPDRVEVLFLGSSTTLHGLDSSILREQLRVSGDLLNLGVQDLRVNQVKFVADVFLDHYSTVRHVVMVSTLLDYKECNGAAETEFFRPKDVLDYVSNGWAELYYYFRYLDIRGVLSRAGDIHHLRNVDNNLESVHFSPSGSVLIDVPREAIVDRVWYGDPIELEPACYEALRGLAQNLQSRGIAFTFVLAPMRPGYLDYQDPEGTHLATHRQKVASALSGTGAYVIDAHAALEMPEEAFFDAYHVRPSEARKLTRFIGERIVAGRGGNGGARIGQSDDLRTRSGG